MRTILHVERRRAQRKAPTGAPRDLRRARHPRRHCLGKPCGYLPTVFSLS